MADHCRSCQAPMPCRCCRLYRGVLNADGYGVVNRGQHRWDRAGRYKGRRPKGLHRWVMEQVLGRELRSDEVVRHACDQRACFYIGHLTVGTQQENLQDMRDREHGHVLAALPGVANPNALLTDDDVRYIRSMRGRCSSIHLGRQLGVHHSTVRAVWSGKAWRHVVDV